jgi:metal-dependent amidase/aminoacylase/carboxypeptidase family protein
MGTDSESLAQKDLSHEGGPAVDARTGRETLGYRTAIVNSSAAAMAADDFVYFAQVAPAFFFSLGSQKPGPTGINHATNFVADDSAIPVGI